MKRKATKAKTKVKTKAKVKAKASKPARPKKKASPIPAGQPAVTPQLTVKGAAQALDFYKRAFGARETMRMATPDGRTVMHAEIRIGNARVFVADEVPDAGPRAPQSLGGTTASLYVYVRDVDATHQRAVAAGATAIMPVTDMFWGDRFGTVRDPFGHEWGLATHKEDLTPRETARRAKAFFAQPG